MQIQEIPNNYVNSKHHTSQWKRQLPTDASTTTIGQQKIQQKGQQTAIKDKV